MEVIEWGMLGGFFMGTMVGVVFALFIMQCLMYHREKWRCCREEEEKDSRREASVAIGINEADASTTSTLSQESSRISEWNKMPALFEGLKRKDVVSAFGIPRYSYKDLQKATYDFTTKIGQGGFGTVYKAQMATGDTLAVKVLASTSRKGEKEFQTEVLVLGRLHHRNLMNLVGYSGGGRQHMLVFVYMSNGSLASHLYNEKISPLPWELRVQIALDVARGLEYLHYGAIPPVVHRDIKSSNILLDQFMKARVADFGLSSQVKVNPQSSNVRGTFGYLDPEYTSTRTFTKKSDVYSFGVLLFELISGRNPQLGLMEYVELAAIDVEGNLGWLEITDSRLDGNFNFQELNLMAALAYQCVRQVSRDRPTMRDVVQELSQILKLRHRRTITG